MWLTRNDTAEVTKAINTNEIDMCGYLNLSQDLFQRALCMCFHILFGALHSEKLLEIHKLLH